MRLLRVLFVLVLVAGCESVKQMPAGDPQLSYGYAQLHDLMKRESGVSDLLMIRDVSEPTQALIELVADTAADAAERIEAYADEDKSLQLSDTGLPSIETDTRSAIAAATAGLLLTGDHAERDLLLTQIKATQYAEYLTSTLAKADPDARRTAYLNELSGKFHQIGDKLSARLSPR